MRARAVEPTRALDKIITFLTRRRYRGKFKAGIDQRMRAMLTLAAQIARAKNASPRG